MTPAPKFRTSLPGHSPVRIDFSDSPSRAKQSFKEACDINNIAAKARQSGFLAAPQGSPLYGDFSGANDYREALHVVMRAEEQFSALPAAVRDRFQNDPAAFLAFATDSSNEEELIKLGLATRRAAAEPPAPAPEPAKKAKKEPVDGE